MGVGTKIKNFFKKIGSGIKKGAMWIGNKLKTVVKPVAGFVSKLGIPKVSEVAGGIHAGIGIGEGIYESAKNLIGGIKNKDPEAIKEHAGAIKEQGQNLFNGVQNLLKKKKEVVPA